MAQGLESRLLDPRLGAHRIQALLDSFTSPMNACPYYDKKVRSSCALDPSSRRVWDCQGICFSKGFCCNYIIDGSTQIEESLKGLQSFSLRKK
ncbi:MAG TPA: hypothetical protein VMV49_17150 [Candidatus Deferrimicrobium sp.]|nr:hypothetical protein [Candidatus Deferrimicrobium sp.]